MPDRYDTGVMTLQGIEPPDQWDDIRRRASRGLIVPLDGDRPQRRLRWPTLLAAAAVLVLVVGAAALLLRDGDDVTTNPSDPGLTPPIDGPDESSTTTQPQATTTQPETTTEVPTGQLPACPLGLGLTTNTPPAGWDATMTPREGALPADPPTGTADTLAGVFEGPTTADNVFVFGGLLNLQDDTFAPTPGPLPGSDALIAPWEGGWYLELGIPHPAADCSITLQAIGMTNEEARQFVQGLQGS